MSIRALGMVILTLAPLAVAGCQGQSYNTWSGPKGPPPTAPIVREAGPRTTAPTLESAPAAKPTPTPVAAPTPEKSGSALLGDPPTMPVDVPHKLPRAGEPMPWQLEPPVRTSDGC